MSKGSLEKQLTAEGRLIAGVDEVGRGCLAGPVVAACVRLDYERLWRLSKKCRQLIRDSKTLSSEQRQAQLPIIHELCVEFATGEATVSEIEEFGILRASFMAMNRAIHKFSTSVCILLVDGNQKIKEQPLPQMPIVKGDSLCFAVAAASIIAKEHRDSLMRAQALIYPAYGFHSNVGYGTADHLKAIRTVGITPLHRKTFAPVRETLQSF